MIVEVTGYASLERSLDISVAHNPGFTVFVMTDVSFSRCEKERTEG